MTQYIDKDALVAEIEGLKSAAETMLTGKTDLPYWKAQKHLCERLLSFIDTLKVKEVDLEKLGEIARHLIAVKHNIEDMRLDSNEWLLLEKIGYPERFRTKQE